MASAAPLPKVKVLVVGCLLLSCHLAAIMIFPFLPFMVQDFFPELSKEELGKKVGYLASAYYFGNFAGSLLWGWMSDQWGRRPVMLLGICGSIFSELLFGFSQNFTWAVSARFLWGLLNGNLGVAKTYLSEISEDSNQAKAFAFAGVSIGLGRLVGSLVGGFLSQPASKYPPFEDGFFCTFPYLLPCLVSLALDLCNLIASFLFLHESLPGKKGCPSCRRGHRQGYSVTFANRGSTEIVSLAVKTDDGDTLSLDMEDSSLPPLVRLSALRGRLRLMRDRRVILAVTVSSLFGFVAVTSNEAFPLLMVTDFEHGGYDLDDNEIGVFISIIAMVHILFQILLFPLMVKKLGYRWTFRLIAFVFITGCILTPFSNTITGPIVTNESNTTIGGSGSGWAGSGLNSTDYCGLNTAGSEGAVNEDSIKRIPPLVWLVVAGGLVLVVIPRVTCFTVLLVMISNSSLPETRGTVNGLAQTLGALSRSVAPTFGSLTFAWSEENTDGGASWPLNYHLVYDMCAVLGLLVVTCTFLLPRSIEKKRDHPSSSSELTPTDKSSH